MIKYLRSIICCFFVLAVCVSYAQSEEFVGRLVYRKLLPNNETQIVVRFSDTEQIFTIQSDQCFDVSDQQNYIAVSQRDNPSTLTIFQLDTGSQALEISWDSEWILPCHFAWRSDTTFNIYQALPLEHPREYFTVDIVTEMITGPHVSNNTPFEEPQLPNYFPGGDMFYLQSPNPDIFVYEYCLSGVESVSGYGPGCAGDDDMVVYDMAQDVIIETLEDAPQLIRDIEIYAYLTWSPSGRYLAYRAIGTPNMKIFDVLAEQYLDTTPINETCCFHDGTKRMQFSPDELKLGFWLRDPDGPTGWESFLSIFDSESSTFTIFQKPYRGITGFPWFWSPDSEAVIFVENDGSLVMVNLDETESVLDTNVEYILSWDDR